MEKFVKINLLTIKTSIEDLKYKITFGVVEGRDG